MAVATKVYITDPALFRSHHQKETAYQGTKTLIDEELPKLNKSISQIEEFSTDVRAQGKAYQEATAPPELTTDLVREQKSFLAQYEGFKSTYAKTLIVIENIKKTIVFLTPVPKTWAEERTFELNAPQLYVQSKESERICLEHIATLTQHEVEFTDSKDKLYALINNTTVTWSLQRFCGIVDNGGKPLSTFTRFANYISPYIFTPAFPKASDINVPTPPPSEPDEPKLSNSLKASEEFDRLFPLEDT